MVTLATEHGTSGLAAFGFGLYALASFLFNLDEGYRAGTIGLRLMEKYKAVELTAKMYGLFYAHVDVWYAQIAPPNHMLVSHRMAI
jgi:predicted ATPase